MIEKIPRAPSVKLREQMLDLRPIANKIIPTACGMYDSERELLSDKSNMYNNRVLVGNWYEEQNSTFTLQKDGNKDTIYQKDYQLRTMPTRNERKVWQIKERALGLPIELCREHGSHNVYSKNMCSLYDLNCMFAYNYPPVRRFQSISQSWVPQQNFISNYGPGRNELVKRKQESWITDYHNFRPNTEYQLSYTLK